MFLRLVFIGHVKTKEGEMNVLVAADESELFPGSTYLVWGER